MKSLADACYQTQHCGRDFQLGQHYHFFPTIFPQPPLTPAPPLVGYMVMGQHMIISPSSCLLQAFKPLLSEQQYQLLLGHINELFHQHELL